MDADLREAQRSAAQGDPEAEARHLRARVRAGTLSPDMLELAAYCGHEAAQVAIGGVCLTDCDRDCYDSNGVNCNQGLLLVDPVFGFWLNGLTRWTREVETECTGPLHQLAGVFGEEHAQEMASGCTLCDGTGKVPKEVPEALLRAAVACARACLIETMPARAAGRWMTAHKALKAAKRYLENPTEENRRAVTCPDENPGFPMWIWHVAAFIDGDSDLSRLPTAIKSAAEILTEKTARTVIQAALIEWALDF